jgi:hypothetical protein
MELNANRLPQSRRVTVVGWYSPICSRSSSDRATVSESR